MSLDISKLKQVRARGAKTIARCPACAETDADKKGEHLVINENGKFGCVVYPGDSPEAKAHRKRIFALCGNREIRPLIVHSKKSYLGNTRGKKSGLFAKIFAREFGNSVPAVPVGTHGTANLTSRAKKNAKNTDENVREIPVSCAAQVEKRRPRRPTESKKCIVGGADYKGWPESEYCGNACARQHDTSKNPSRERKKYLRQQCRLSWQHATERTGPKNFDTWLHNFEERLERMRETNGSK